MRLVLLLALALAGCEASAPAPSSPRLATVSGTPPAAPGAARAAGAGLALALPTANRALFEGRPEAFYQGLNVTIDSLRPERWEGGQYGFVRDPVPTIFGWKTFRRVHEGIDIAPTGRDAEGNPVDTVAAIAPGRVAYVNRSPGASSYGTYVVVEHTWSGSPVYSLYAHLADAFVAEGASVGRGAPLGRMGFSGRGLGRDRAHLHLEIALLLNQHQRLWFAEHHGANDLHGLFFGTNLAGVPPAELYRALQDTPGLTFPEFVRGLDAGYVVTFPGGQPLDLLARYPWLGEAAAAADPATVPAWRITFTQEGLPIAVAIGQAPVERPTVEGVSLLVWLTDASTNRVLQRRGLEYEPSRRGYTYFSLIATTADGAPRY